MFPWQLCPRGHGHSGECRGRSFVSIPLGGRRAAAGAPPDPRGDGRTACPAWLSRSEIQGVPLPVEMPWAPENLQFPLPKGAVKIPLSVCKELP